MLAMSELGEQLKHARLDKNLSLDEVQTVTKIQKRYLEAIENGGFDKLPGSFYTKAFIKSYAEAVGLNYDSLMEQFEHELPRPSQPVESLPPRKTRTSIPSPTRSKFAAALPGLFVFLIVIGILAIIWMLSINSNNDSTLNDVSDDSQNVEVEQNKNAISNKDNKVEPIKEEESDDNVDNEVDEENDNTDEQRGQLEKVSVSGDTTNYVLSDTDEFHVEFTFSGESWLKIQGDSGKVYVNEGYSDEQDATFDFRDEPSVRIRIGSTPHVKMMVNGIDIDLEQQPVAQTVKIEFHKEVTD